jgi:predicted CoA-binding protein
VLGVQIVQQAAELGVRHIFIQPGAGSDEIEALCATKGLVVHHGCVLRELTV